MGVLYDLFCMKRVGNLEDKGVVGLGRRPLIPWLQDGGQGYGCCTGRFVELVVNREGCGDVAEEQRSSRRKNDELSI